jgi:hypothetical protein
MHLTIAYITGRAEPHVEWVLQGLARQREPADVIDFIVIDALGRSREILAGDRALAESAVQDLRVVATKPNIWQGRHRVTAVDWWAKSAAANTALCLARHDYVAFLDDCSRLGDHWLNAARVGCRERKSVLAGAYEKIEGGNRIPDHRLKEYPGGRKDCGGGWLYGCSIALPLAWCLEVNGFEEGCDGMSSEDYIFGFMLANSGRRIDFTPSLFVSLERGSQLNAYKREDKGPLNHESNKSNQAVRRFGKRKRTEFTPDLKDLRARIARGEQFPIPDPNGDYRDWYDNVSIRGLR